MPIKILMTFLQVVCMYSSTVARGGGKGVSEVTIFIFGDSPCRSIWLCYTTRVYIYLYIDIRINNWNQSLRSGNHIELFDANWYDNIRSTQFHASVCLIHWHNTIKMHRRETMIYHYLELVTHCLAAQIVAIVSTAVLFTLR